MVPGCLGVDGEESPVDEAPVAQVGVVAVLRGEAEDLLHQILRLGRLLQEQLHGRRQQLQLHLGVLVLWKQGFQKRCYQLSHFHYFRDPLEIIIQIFRPFPPTNLSNLIELWQFYSIG